MKALRNCIATETKNSLSPGLFETKHSRMDQVKFFKGCLPQILLVPFLNTLPYLVGVPRLKSLCILSLYYNLLGVFDVKYLIWGTLLRVEYVQQLSARFIKKFEGIFYSCSFFVSKASSKCKLVKSLSSKMCSS